LIAKAGWQFMSTMRIDYVDFMLIGAAKSGTTALQAYLCNHPRVLMTNPKEPEFFSRQEVFEKGEAWYRDLYRKADATMCRGEASTTYTRWPHTLDSAALIKEWTSTRKFIYIVRSPVDRAFSHYAHHMRKGVTMTFEQAIESDTIYFDCGDYMRQLDRYRQHFSDESFLVLLAEDLARNPVEVLGKVQEFLGLPNHCVADIEIQRNANSESHFLRSKTTGMLRSIKGISPVIDLLPRVLRHKLFHVFENSKLGRFISSKHHVQKMQPETRAELTNRYRDSVHALSEFIKRDLSHWLR
jgi:hypothetical protein